MAWAREHGYGGRLKKAFFALKKRDRNLAYRKRLSAADRSRFTDTLGGGPDTPMLSIRLPAGGAVRSPDGGCQHNARRNLYGDTEAFFRNDKIAMNLVAVYMSKIMDDPRFKKGLDAWSRCMRTRRAAISRTRRPPAPTHSSGPRGAAPHRRTRPRWSPPSRRPRALASPPCPGPFRAWTASMVIRCVTGTPTRSQPATG